MSNVVAVRLLKPVGLNNAGEVCGFPEEKAERMVKAGLAVREGPKDTPADIEVGEGMDKMVKAAPPRRKRRDPNGD